MPDEAKHAALGAQGFRLARTCSGCAHWRPSPGERWGHCALATYTHGKHTGERQAGTPDIGTCDRWEDDGAARRVGDDYAARYVLEDSPEEPAWLLWFDDADAHPELFARAGAASTARKAFESARQHWTVRLFREVLSS